MRRSLRLALAAAAVVAFAAPAAPASAMYCPFEPLATVCKVRCDLHTRLGMSCPR